MYRWGMLAAGLCASGWIFVSLVNYATANYPQPEPIALVQELDFPYAVENTQMTVREMALYEGPFWEDGSGEEVADVCALVIENTGGTMIAQGEIILQTSGGQLVFSVSWLPPDSVALVPEKNRTQRLNCSVLSCSGWNTTIYPEMTGAVTAAEQGMGELVFTNHTTQPIDAVEAIYKAYDADCGMYIGGSAGTVCLSRLLPGEDRAVKAYRYAKGSSKVVCILLASLDGEQGE